MTSIRRRVLAGALAAILLALAGAGIAVHLSFHAALLAEFDANLALQARSLAALVEVDHEDGRLRYHAEIPATWNDGSFRVRREDGQVIATAAAAGSLPADGPAVDRLVMLAGADHAGLRLGTWRCPVRVEDNEEAERRGTPATPVHVLVTVMRSTAGLDRTMQQLAWVLVAVIAGTSVVAVSAIAVFMGQALAPLERLAERISGMDDRSLQARLDPPHCRELEPVVQRLNQLFDRLDHAFAKEKSFNAAIAHELRTPLAGLLTTLEVCAIRERSGDEYREALAVCQRIAGEMQAMAERLLLLAKLDADQLPTAPRTLDLQHFLTDCWASLAAAASQRSQVAEWHHAADLLIVADRDLLRMVFSNLFDNAISHGEPSGTMAVTTSASADAVTIVIRNSGCHLPPAAFSQLAARFWRGDAARQATGRHCGLGLSLCQELLRALRGSLVLHAEAGWFVATVTLPRSDAAGAAGPAEA